MPEGGQCSWEDSTRSPQDEDGDDDEEEEDEDDDEDGNDAMMTKPPTGVLPKKGRSVSYTCSGPGLAWPSRGVGVCWGSAPGAP